MDMELHHIYCVLADPGARETWPSPHLLGMDEPQSQKVAKTGPKSQTVTSSWLAGARGALLASDNVR